MAAQMSSLTGVDEDDKDAEPEINALSLLQEPVTMAQQPGSSSGSLCKPSLKQNCVIDVLSNTDMLSSVGLGNGPALHQATQANELNSISTEKEEEKSITPLKTVQEIDTAGLWGFDADSPENSLDNISSDSNVHWDPHKEFMQFLWENNGDSPGEESKADMLPTNCQKRRKRKMDMVVMADPSEDLYPDLSHKSSEDLSDAEDPGDSSHVRKSRKFSKLLSSPTECVSKYPNGTAKAIKEILCSAPARHSQGNNLSHRLSPLKGMLTINSHSEKPSCYPCSKCKLIFKKEHHLHRHLKSHADSPNHSQKLFICRECGQSYRHSDELLEHMSIHEEKRARATEAIKRSNNRKKADKKLFCPQCPFVTNCPNTFVEHAKTHEKDKRKFRCDKCSFRTMYETDLRRHNVLQHTVVTVRKQIQNQDQEAFSCNICSYRAFSKNIFKNHLMRRHQQTFEEYRGTQPNPKGVQVYYTAPITPNHESGTFSCDICSYRAFSKDVMRNHLMRRHKKTFEEYEASQKNGQPSKEQYVPTCRSPVEDAEFMSEISIQNQISTRRACSLSETNDISDLFQNSKIKRGLKYQLTESKLDKSINVLLSRQQHGKKTDDLNKESNNSSTSFQDLKNEDDGFDQSPEILTVKVEDSALSPNGYNVPSTTAQFNADLSTVKKSPSKRKMSTPYRNTSDQDSCFILPKQLPSPKKTNQEEEQLSDFDNLQFKDTKPNTNSFDDVVKEEKQNIIYTYSRRMSMRGALQASKRLFEKIKTEEQDESEPEIKEECIETEVCGETFEPHQLPLSDSFFEELSESDHKNCPYCPAVFESGVGLSNHIRGHLHRVGLSYNARHVVPPEQVACQDQRPRIRRKMSALRRLKKALRMESKSQTVNIHSCPLCGDSFDNRTGQSNHIRGHLKKLGRTFSTKSKSPIVLLRELMRDKKEFQRAVQILGKRQNHYQCGASPKLSSTDRFSPSPTGIPKSNSVPRLCNDAKPLMSTFSSDEMESEESQVETKLDIKNSLSGTNALIGILKKRRCQEDARLRGSTHMSKNPCSVTLNSEHTSRVEDSLPNEKGEFNRKVCLHCNATFHSGVSLSNHLRAYAKRKRTALLEGNVIECKVRRQRSRPGPKKKLLPLPQTPEEMYRLTCRFCDLVFQGPLSVQEDWIKHLQRHIMNTSVPHTGLGMVEVTSLPTDSQVPKTDLDCSLMTTHAAS